MVRVCIYPVKGHQVLLPTRYSETGALRRDPYRNFRLYALRSPFRGANYTVWHTRNCFLLSAAQSDLHARLRVHHRSGRQRGREHLRDRSAVENTFNKMLSVPTFIDVSARVPCTPVFCSTGFIPSEAHYILQQ